MEDIDQKILEKLNQMQVDIQFIKENVIEDGELTEWAENELAEARKIPDSQMIFLEEVERKIAEK